MDVTAIAEKEIVDLHVLLQEWFRGEGEADPQPILNHMTQGYCMVGAAGRPILRDTFAAALPKLYGSRPGLVMEIKDVVVRATGADGHLVTYKEIQTQDGSSNERWSAVLFQPGDNAQPLLWHYLQETFLAT